MVCRGSSNLSRTAGSFQLISPVVLIEPIFGVRRFPIVPYQYPKGDQMQRESLSQTFPLGSPLPDFTLPATDGASVASIDFFSGASAALVVFVCNHCPYVKGSDQEFVDIAKQFGDQGLRIVAISSNDAVAYPEDSFEKMGEKAEMLNLPFPYLYDETQKVAHLFDAQCTPECYLFNRDLTLVYHGAINDSPRDPSKVTRHFLRDAVGQLLKDGSTVLGFSHPTGCSIKWKS
jgi:peroxiredoxin